MKSSSDAIRRVQGRIQMCFYCASSLYSGVVSPADS